VRGKRGIKEGWGPERAAMGEKRGGTAVEEKSNHSVADLRCLGV